MNNWLPLIATLSIQAMVAMALLTLPVMAPVAAKALQVSPALVGMYVAVTYLGAMLASLISGTTVARWGAIRVSQWGLWLCAAGLVLCAVPWLPSVAVGAFLIGLGYGPITPASSHLLARTTPAHQMALVFSIKQTGVPVGAMVAGAVVPSLLLLLDWQVTLLVVALVCSASALLSETIRAEFDLDLNPESKLDWGSLIFPIRMVLSHRPLATMAACSFMFSMAQMSLMTYLVTYLHEDLSYTMVSAGLYLSVTQIGGIGGRIAWGYVADRWLGAQPTLVLLAGSMAVSAFATAVFLPLISTWAVWIILFVFGASAIGWNGVYLAEVARKAPAGHASTATGGTLAITFLGVVIGPPLFGMLSTVFGTYSAGYLALVPTSTLCGLVLFFNHRQQTRSKIQVN